MKKLKLAVRTLTLATLLATNAWADPVQVWPGRDAGYTTSLNGDWSFKYVAGADEGADSRFHQPSFDTGAWGKLAVPSHWELAGYAEPKYAMALEEGLGLYRRDFQVPAGWQGRRVFLRFEGVANGFELWVNGKPLGASTASAYNPHTFDVTEALVGGAGARQTVALRVRTQPLGYEFDVNDDWALSGIFRDVRLFALPTTHVLDVSTATTLAADGAANLSVAVQMSEPGATIDAVLTGPDGKPAARFTLPAGANGRHQASVRIAKPSLWSAESPSLYRLVLTARRGATTLQTVEERIGLRQVTIAGGVLLLNGKPVKLRGVDHHDQHPLTGRAMTEAQMREDLELMKKANINFIRTSHYPPQPRLIELCDEMGFYVMDEVSIGKGEEHQDKASHRGNILARVAPTVNRDKNRPSVLVWSIGNENPLTDAELEASRMAKELDPTRPVTLPKVGTYFLENQARIPAFIDIHAPHYLNNAQLAQLAGNVDRPVILTEYAHALGLSTDRIQDQWEFIQAHPKFAGGAIWHFHDQGILRTSDQPVDVTKPTQFVWLDSRRYYDTNRNDGADGLVYTDRRPQTDYWQTRKVYAPIQVVERSAAVKPGRQSVAVTIENRYDFRSLQGSRLEWTLQRNGQALQSGQARLAAPARGRETVAIAVDVPADARGDVLALAVRCVDQDGVQINERVLRLDVDGKRVDTAFAAASGGPALQVTDTAAEVKVAGAHGVMQVTRATGMLTLHDAAGRLIVAGLLPHSGRKPTMSDLSSRKATGAWQATTLPKLVDPAVRASRTTDGVLVSVNGRWPRPDAPDQAWTGGYELRIAPSGVIDVRYAFTPDQARGTVTEAGLSLVLPAQYGEFRWLGQGPYAGYPGKDRLNDYGLYHLNRADLRFQGNRRDTTLALLTDAQGSGIAVGMQPGDLAVEREGDTTLLSHNALVASPGNKMWVPETQVSMENTARIEGRFSLLPLGGKWPVPLQRWFGQPKAASDVLKPYYHSYDQ